MLSDNLLRDVINFFVTPLVAQNFPELQELRIVIPAPEVPEIQFSNYININQSIVIPPLIFTTPGSEEVERILAEERRRRIDIGPWLHEGF